MRDEIPHNMDADNPNESFADKLRRALKKYDEKKDVSRFFAVGLRFTTVLLGAGITVLLGWKHNGSVEYRTNAALVFGATISVMNAIDSFWSFSGRWTHYKNICTQLIFLKKDFEDESNLDESKLNAYTTRFRTVVMEARQGELEMHKKRGEKASPNEKESNSQFR